MKPAKWAIDTIRKAFDKCELYNHMSYNNAAALALQQEREQTVKLVKGLDLINFWGEQNKASAVKQFILKVIRKRKP